MPIERRRFRSGFVVLGICALVVLASATSGSAATPTDSPPGRNIMSDVVFVLFDNDGTRIGRVSVDHVGVEYRRHGFLSVAWDPSPRIEGLNLELTVGAEASDQMRQLQDSLRSLGARGYVVVRHAHVVIHGTATVEIASPAGLLHPDGSLELIDAEVRELPKTFEAPRLLVWICGPRLGQFTPFATPSAKVASVLNLPPRPLPP